MTQKTALVRDRHEVERTLQIEPRETANEIVDFVKKVFNGTMTKGIVIGLSGGIDSAVTASLCVKAIGHEKVTGLLLFEKRATTSEDSEDARKLSEMLGMETIEFPIDELCETFLS